MLRISSSKINDITADIAGKTINGIRYSKSGEPVGLMATFSSDAADEQLAMAGIKKYLKEKYPVLRIYVEVI